MIVEAMVDMVARLAAGGVRAGLHAADLAPPAVLVLPPTVTYGFSGDRAEAAWSLLAAVPDSGVQAVAALSDLVEQVRVALDYEVVTATAASATMTEGPPVPAFRLEFTTDIGG